MEDEFDMILTHTFEVVDIKSEEEQVYIFNRYTELLKTNRTVWESFNLVQEKYKKEFKND